MTYSIETQQARVTETLPPKERQWRLLNKNVNAAFVILREALQLANKQPRTTEITPDQAGNNAYDLALIIDRLKTSLEVLRKHNLLDQRVDNKNTRETMRQLELAYSQFDQFASTDNNSKEKESSASRFLKKFKRGLSNSGRLGQASLAVAFPILPNEAVVQSVEDFAESASEFVAKSTEELLGNLTQSELALMLSQIKFVEKALNIEPRYQAEDFQPMELSSLEISEVDQQYLESFENLQLEQETESFTIYSIPLNFDRSNLEDALNSFTDFESQKTQFEDITGIPYAFESEHLFNLVGGTPPEFMGNSEAVLILTEDESGSTKLHIFLRITEDTEQAGFNLPAGTLVGSDSLTGEAKYFFNDVEGLTTQALVVSEELLSDMQERIPEEFFNLYFGNLAKGDVIMAQVSEDGVIHRFMSQKQENGANLVIILQYPGESAVEEEGLGHVQVIATSEPLLIGGGSPLEENTVDPIIEQQKATYESMLPGGDITALFSEWGNRIIGFNPEVGANGAYEDQDGNFFFPGLGTETSPGSGQFSDIEDGWVSIDAVAQTDDFVPGQSGLKIEIANPETGAFQFSFHKDTPEKAIKSFADFFLNGISDEEVAFLKENGLSDEYIPERGVEGFPKIAGKEILLIVTPSDNTDRKNTPRPEGVKPYVEDSQAIGIIVNGNKIEVRVSLFDEIDNPDVFERKLLEGLITALYALELNEGSIQGLPAPEVIDATNVLGLLGFRLYSAVDNAFDPLDSSSR